MGLIPLARWKMMAILSELSTWRDPLPVTPDHRRDLEMECRRKTFAAPILDAQCHKYGKDESENYFRIPPHSLFLIRQG
jgi:hypothetical protein